MQRNPHRNPEMARKSPLPPYFKWRNGRPRWEPGPGLRVRGFHGRDLKDESGAWLSKGAAIDAAENINRSVADGDGVSGASARPQGHTMEALIDRYHGSEAYNRLAPRTKVDYDDNMRIIVAWARDDAGASLPLDAIKREHIRKFHAALRDGRGPARAHSILRNLRMLLNFAVSDLEWIAKNRAAKMKLPTGEGRLVMWKPEEIIAFVACADWMGLESQGDAQILGLCTGQNRVDVITAPPFALQDGVFVMHRKKTGRPCFIPPVKPLTDRIRILRARNAKRWPGVTFPTEIVSSRLGRPYPADGSYFIKEHLQVRRMASGEIFAAEDAERAAAGLPPKVRNLPFTPCPTLREKTFQDLRDTAVTMLYAATRDIGRVANTTGHSLKTAQAIIDKHYFVRNAALARDAGEGFEKLLLDANIG